MNISLENADFISTELMTIRYILLVEPNIDELKFIQQFSKNHEKLEMPRKR